MFSNIYNFQVTYHTATDYVLYRFVPIEVIFENKERSKTRIKLYYNYNIKINYKIGTQKADPFLIIYFRLRILILFYNGQNTVKDYFVGIFEKKKCF